MRWIKKALFSIAEWIDRKFPDQVLLTPATFEHFKSTIQHAVALNQSIGSEIGKYNNELELQRKKILELQDKVRACMEAMKAGAEFNELHIKAMEQTDLDMKKLKEEFSAFAVSQGFAAGRKPFER